MNIGFWLCGVLGILFFLTTYMAIPTFVIWLVLFLKDAHFDTHKAFFTSNLVVCKSHFIEIIIILE